MTAEGDCHALLWNLVDIVNLASGTNQVQISRNPIAKDGDELKLWLQSDHIHCLDSGRCMHWFEVHHRFNMDS